MKGGMIADVVPDVVLVNANGKWKSNRATIRPLVLIFHAVISI